MKRKTGLMVALLFLTIISGMYSCQKNRDEAPRTGRLKFSMSSPAGDSALKSAAADSTGQDTMIYSSYQILISVETPNGIPVLDDKIIPLYSFGNGYISGEIEMNTGEYLLSKFMVLNNYGKVIYAAPVAGSERAYLVDQPLPLYFSITVEYTTQVSPQVLAVDGYTPADFGYVSFGVDFVSTLTVYIAAEVTDPVTMGPNLYTAGELLVYSYNGWSHYYHLEATANKLEIRTSDYYDLVFYRDGFAETRVSASLSDLKGSTEDNPFVIKIDNPDYQTMVFRPGPEDGKDAYLTDLQPDQNFGDHFYFESTYLSDSILTVMRTTRSLIGFDLGQLPAGAQIKQVNLTLHYDIPVPWDLDSLWYLNQRKCNCLLSGAALQQVIEPWDEHTVTWNNQPKTTEISQVLIYPFIKNANFVDYDVTSIFVPNPYIDSVPLPNYGIMLRLYPVEDVPGFRFASSDYPDENMRPLLTVRYTLPGE
jgi:hypothetical protein